MQIITNVENQAENNQKISLEKTIDGRSRKAIMSIALRLKGRPRIVDWTLIKDCKSRWQ